MLRVLILNASPREHGNIANMTEAIADEARSLQAEVTLLNACGLQVRPCCGCMTCREKRTCVYPIDDAQRILEYIRLCDILVIGVPCYWGNMPGELKVVFDRIVYGLMKENKYGIPQPLHKGKKAILLSTSTTPYPFNIWFGQSRGAIRALRKILKWSGFKVCATIEFGGTHHRNVDDNVLRKCKKAIRRLLR